MSPSQKLMFTLLILMGSFGVELAQIVYVEVNIINGLESRETLQVHCKDKHHDLGVHQVQANQAYGFTITPGDRTDYFCGFVFQNVLHWFDAYTDDRDLENCGRVGRCDWHVKEDGPCGGTDPTHCYPWNKNSITLS